MKIIEQTKAQIIDWLIDDDIDMADGDYWNNILRNGFKGYYFYSDKELVQEINGRRREYDEKIVLVM